MGTLGVVSLIVIILGIIGCAWGAWYYISKQNDAQENNRRRLIIIENNEKAEETNKKIRENMQNGIYASGWRPSLQAIKEVPIEISTKGLKVLSSIFGVMCLVLLGAFAFVPFSIKTVDATEVVVVKHWGEAQETRQSGTHFDFWVAKSYVYYPITTQEINEQIEAYSQDAQPMTASLVVQYKINPSQVIEITKEYGDNNTLKSRIQSIAEERVKSVLSNKQAMAIIETRATLSADIVNAMDGIFDKYHITISNVVINDITFSQAFESAVEQKMIAEQEQLKAEYERQKKITEADALLEVAKKEALASIEKSKGDAEALQIMQEAWDSLSTEVKEVMLKQLAIERWDGKLPQTMVGDEFLTWLLGQI